MREGEVLAAEGSPADRMIVLLEGELQGRSEQAAGDGRVFITRTGDVTGMLPYSRLTHFPDARFAPWRPRASPLCIKDHFPEMVERFPELAGRLVGIMADRIRYVTRDEQQREKLMALGKLSAGLAHELNNPASAASRAAENLREAVCCMRSADLALDRLSFPPNSACCSPRPSRNCWRRHPPRDADPLERSDREQAIGDWLEARGLADAWRLAGVLADAGFDRDRMEQLTGELPTEVLIPVLDRLAAALSVTRLVEEIESSSRRISQLVKAVKEYSYMDQGSEQEMDIHDGLENTLLILGHRLKRGIQVKREYDRSLPKICAFGSELNQVWTNLIVNAIDAMGDTGELQIRTAARRQRPAGGDRRFRPRHSAGGQGSHLRALLHHQASRARHRARSGHREPHRPQTSRLDPLRKPTGAHGFPGSPSLSQTGSRLVGSLIAQRPVCSL